MKFKTLIKMAVVSALTLAFLFGIAVEDAAAANYIVTRSDDRNFICDSGVNCSLREAIAAASSGADDDTINFATNVSLITLTIGVIVIDTPMGAITINGRGANLLTIDGGAGTNRIFRTDNATLTIRDVTLTGGNGLGINSGFGGAIYTVGGTLTLDRVHVTGNTVTGVGSGAGVYVTGGANHVIRNSTFSGNSSSFCGGLYSFSAPLTIINTTFSGNSASQNGGALCNGNPNTLTLRNVTITGNTAGGDGGGVYRSAGIVNVGNSIIAGNTDTSTGNLPDVGGSFTSAGYNLVGIVGTATGFPFPGDQVGTSGMPLDPMLGPLQLNGGTVPTHALLLGSPAIDSASNSLAALAGLTTDQRGLTRRVDGNRNGTATVDKGAFEFRALQRSYDFDGDGKADVSVFRPANGFWYLLQSQLGFTGTAFGQNGDLIVPADYDGDAKTDLAVYRNGTWYLQRSQLGFTGIAFGTATDLPMPADFDSDGKAELAVFRPSNGTWYIFNLATSLTSAVAFGANGDVPVAADYDVDGRADVAVFRPSNNTWYLQRSTAEFTAVTFGASGDKPVPADYDGDGRADVAVFRPSNGTWYLQRSTLGFTALAFGAATDLPALADFDGDNVADVAVFRPFNGTWYLQQSSAGFTNVGFGASGDRAVPNAFVP